MSEEGVTKSACGAAKLLAVIFHKDPDELKVKMGLPPSRYRCSVCLCPISPRKDKSGICQKCLRERRNISISCSECGNVFERNTSYVLSRIGRGYQHFFCNRVCVGRYAGKHYGFGAHPENAGKSQRKYDWDLIWSWHKLTGWGGRKLSGHLNLPESAIGMVIFKMRRELNDEGGGRKDALP